MLLSFSVSSELSLSEEKRMKQNVGRKGFCFGLAQESGSEVCIILLGQEKGKKIESNVEIANMAQKA